MSEEKQGVNGCSFGNEEENPFEIQQGLKCFPISYLVLDSYEEMSSLEKGQICPQLFDILRNKADERQKLRGQLEDMAQLDDIGTVSGQKQAEESFGWEAPPVNSNQIQMMTTLSSFQQNVAELRLLFRTCGSINFLND